MSFEPPGGKPTIRRIGLLGYACPEPVDAGCAHAFNVHNAKTVDIV